MKLTERQVLDAVGNVGVRQFRLWVSQGWVLPTHGEHGPVFDETDVARTRLICQLRHDMNVNADAMSVVLALLDQLYGLRRDFRTVMRAIDGLPNDIRLQICEAVRARTRSPED